MARFICIEKTLDLIRDIRVEFKDDDGNYPKDDYTTSMLKLLEILEKYLNEDKNEELNHIIGASPAEKAVIVLLREVKVNITNKTTNIKNVVMCIILSNLNTNPNDNRIFKRVSSDTTQNIILILHKAQVDFNYLQALETIPTLYKAIKKGTDHDKL